MTDEQIKLLIWAYKQGFLDAISALEGAKQAIDETEMLNRFKQLMNKQRTTDAKGDE